MRCTSAPRSPSKDLRDELAEILEAESGLRRQPHDDVDESGLLDAPDVGQVKVHVTDDETVIRRQLNAIVGNLLACNV